MDLKQLLIDNYGLNQISEIKETEHGSGNTFLVLTSETKYIAKMNERKDYLEIYDRVQSVLNKMGLVQSKIIRTKNNQLITPQGIVLYEFISGDIYKTLDESQIEIAIEYIGQYNKALKTVPHNIEEFELSNHWDKAHYIEYLIDELPEYIQDLNIKAKYKKSIYESIQILTDNRDELSMPDKQLIHSDLGSDNLIFINDNHISAIDFTPCYKHELYSLGQFIYWNYLWERQDIDKEELSSFLNIYKKHSIDTYKQDTFYFMLLNAALYRIAAPVIVSLHEGTDYRDIHKRINILDRLLTLIIDY